MTKIDKDDFIAEMVTTIGLAEVLEAALENACNENGMYLGAVRILADRLSDHLEQVQQIFRTEDTTNDSA